ncbi:Arc family DNA-binding protein [Acinetobacter haemolyticus]|uniref:Arc family DNA-binding protein n=1 Tax=Acinetobacter haemolyticus TaxID=29430 RepID=UPI001331CA73|nr:Arc family DNA-binding protein [Acinetobacter haemolyticus]QHI16247.1 Arc family DNA-binding protein [Acinetobacter haemolyticus]
MAKDYTQVNFRIPTKLKEQIEKSANNNERSITAELVARLEQSFSAPETTQSLLEEAVMLTLKAVKDDPNLLNNPKVSTKYVTDNNAERDTVELINKNKAP